MRLMTVRDEHEFASMRREWDGLLAASRQDGPFLRHDWLSAWWEAFGEGELAVVTCRDEDGALLGVLPTFASRSGRWVPVRTARFLGDLSVGSTGLGPFARPEVESEVFARFAAHVRHRSTGWDMLELRYMDREHGFHAHLAGESGTRADPACGRCPRIDLPTQWDDYLAALSKHRRHEVRRVIRRARERNLETQHICGRAGLPAAADELLRLHEDRMRAKLGPGFTVPGPARAFTLRAMSAMLADKRLRLAFLRHDGEAVAGLFAFRYGDTMYAYQSGFGAEPERDVGRAMWALALYGAIREGCSTFDMLLGEQKYKFDWGITSTRELSALRIYNRTPAAAPRRLRDAVRDRADSAPATSPPSTSEGADAPA